MVNQILIIIIKNTNRYFVIIIQVLYKIKNYFIIHFLELKI